MLDTHCHIDEEAFVADREEVIARQRAAGVEAMIVPGVNVASIDTVLDIPRMSKPIGKPRWRPSRRRSVPIGLNWWQ